MDIETLELCLKYETDKMKKLLRDTLERMGAEGFSFAEIKDFIGYLTEAVDESHLSMRYEAWIPDACLHDLLSASS
jgi:hypothetical protein